MSGKWPAWATQPVEISEPDPTWPARALELARDVDGRLVRWLDGSTEHVGSTAVPGLAAKPVLDLAAPMQSVSAGDEIDPTLAAAGWERVPPELDQRPWRRFYVLAEGARRLAHLHLVARDHPRWAEMLVFRDRLRARPDLARQYDHVKRRAARMHFNDREAYSAAKTAFVRDVLAATDRPGNNRRDRGHGPVSR